MRVRDVGLGTQETFPRFWEKTTTKLPTQFGYTSLEKQGVRTKRECCRRRVDLEDESADI